MTIAYTQYLPFVRPHVRMVPDPLLIQAVRAAATEFLKTTRYWHVLAAAQAVLTTTTPRNIAVTTPTGGVPWQPLWVQWHPSAGSSSGIANLTPTTPPELDEECPGWRSHEDTKATPKFFLVRSEGNLLVAPWPASSGAVDYDFAFIPTPDSTGCIDELFNVFHTTIAIGAVARLLVSPDQPWTNDLKGAAFKRVFDHETASAATREDRGRTQAQMTTRTLYR